MKNIYLISRSKKHLEDEIDHLNFEIVLVGNGYFPQKTGLWMRWRKDNSNELIYDKLDMKFGLRTKNINLCQGIFFPESWLWEDAYENILIFGDKDELKNDIAAMFVFASGCSEPKYFPEAFIYKLGCDVKDNRLKISNKGFIYKSDRD